MICERCGAESTEEGTYCNECGAILGAPPPMPPADEGEVPEPVTIEPPLPKPMLSRPPSGSMTPVRNLDVPEALFLISSLLLLAAGLQNMGTGTSGQLPSLLLGIVATIFGLVQMAFVVMPDMMAELDQFRRPLPIVIAILFLIWGMAAVFGANVGMNGGLIVSAGLATALGIMMTEGMIH